MNGVDLKRLAEVEARVAEATPGPWSITGYGPREIRSPLAGGFLANVTVQGPKNGAANAQLIAHAPADLAWLAAELRAALAALHDLREESSAYRRGLRDGAEQELQRVKGVLEEEARFNTRLVPLYDRPASGEFRACVAALYAVIPRLDPKSGEEGP